MVLAEAEAAGANKTISDYAYCHRRVGSVRCPSLAVQTIGVAISGKMAARLGRLAVT